MSYPGEQPIDSNREPYEGLQWKYGMPNDFVRWADARGLNGDPNLDQYLQELSDQPTLASEHEVLALAALARYSPFERTRATAREQLIIGHLGLIVLLAYAVARDEADPDPESITTGILAGNEALIRAVNAYDHLANPKILRNRIAGRALTAIRHTVVSRWHEGGVAQEEAYRIVRIRAARNQLYRELGYEPSKTEIIDAISAQGSSQPSGLLRATMTMSRIFSRRPQPDDPYGHDSSVKSFNEETDTPMDGWRQDENRIAVTNPALQSLLSRSQAEQAAAINQAYLALSPPDQLLFAMFYSAYQYHGEVRPVSTIANILGVPIGSIRPRIMQILTDMAATLEAAYQSSE